MCVHARACACEIPKQESGVLKTLVSVCYSACVNSITHTLPSPLSSTLQVYCGHRLRPIFQLFTTLHIDFVIAFEEGGLCPFRNGDYILELFPNIPVKELKNRIKFCLRDCNLYYFCRAPEIFPHHYPVDPQ